MFQEISRFWTSFLLSTHVCKISFNLELKMYTCKFSRDACLYTYNYTYIQHVYTCTCQQELCFQGLLISIWSLSRELVNPLKLTCLFVCLKYSWMFKIVCQTSFQTELFHKFTNKNFQVCSQVCACTCIHVQVWTFDRVNTSRYTYVYTLWVLVHMYVSTHTHTHTFVCAHT